MFHTIASLLTMTAVALHALLGCCTHHTSECSGRHGLGETQVAIDVDDHCVHGHGHAHVSPDATDNDCSNHHNGHQHGEGDSCDEPDCSFVLGPDGYDITLILCMLNSLSVIDGSTITLVEGGELASSGEGNRPPDIDSHCEPLREVTQVWLL